MANYTVILNDLLQTDFKLNLYSYPIFDENYRDILNQKIINRYRFREIGFYSPDKFNFKIGQVMEEIMPYYNVLYKKLFIENFDVFSNTSIVDSFNKSIIEKSTNNSNIHSNSVQNSLLNDKNLSKKGKEKTIELFNDTPQGQVNIGDINRGGYLSKFNKNESEQLTDSISTNSSNSNINSNDNSISKNNYKNENNENYVLKRIGNSGINTLDLVEKYLTINLNIDTKVIDSLEDLFFKVY